MAEGITAIKNALASTLNPSAFSWDSTEGIVVAILALVIIYRITRNLGDFVGWLIGGLFMIQLGYLMGFTPLNEYIPFSAIFRFDVVTALAQLFTGTPVCDALLYVSAFINFVAKVTSEAAMAAYPPIRNVMNSLFESMPWDTLLGS